MPFIGTPSESELTGEAAEVLQREEENWGYMPNYAYLFAMRPETHRAWGALVGSVRNAMDRRLYELVTVAAARALRSSYCSMAHAKFLITKADDQTGAEVAASGQYERIGAKEAALMRYAEQIVHDASAVTQADIDALQAAGASEDEIINTALAASVRCFFAKFLDATGVRAGQRVLIHFLQVLAADDKSPAGRPVQPTHQVQQGGFAGARRAHDAEELSTFHVQVQPVQRMDDAGPHHVVAAQGDGLDDRSHIIRRR